MFNETMQKVEHTGSRKILIAYFSWSGNTRGIAKEIQRQTGGDLFEIVCETPYSNDYSTVLKEAKRDLEKQARPKLATHVKNMKQLFPMPVASFLEEYDFAGKKIIPFCSHGGVGLGRSVSDITKLAPDAVIGEGLAVHYSGDSNLVEKISEWLSRNGIRVKKK